MGETRKRGTRATFHPGWEPGTLPEEEVLRRGGALYDDGMYWEAHEVWEEVWRRRKGQPDRDFLKGLIQGAAGMWHLSQGNYKGAVSVLGRAIDYLQPYLPAREGVDVDGLQRALRAARTATARARIRARFEGDVRKIRIQPLAAVPTLEVVLDDGTGRLTALFMGRRGIAGVECGRRLAIEGTPVAGERGLTLYNPAYDLR